MDTAREAGVRPLKVMLTTYANKGLAILDGLFAALEEGKDKKQATPKTKNPTAKKPAAKKPAAPKKKP